MQAIAPGTIIFHRYRGYGVIVSVNLLTGWISARFGSEMRTLDLNLSTDDIQHADGEPILFRRTPPERMPQARLMAMVRELQRAGYQRLYLYTWPTPSGLHWRWQLFCGRRNWLERPWREGWYGSGADYNFNPVLGWGDAPGASVAELAEALARFDPPGLAQALGQDSDHSAWFEQVCAALLPNYAFSLDGLHGGVLAPALPVIPVRRNVARYSGCALPWPPGWADLWRRATTSPTFDHAGIGVVYSDTRS